MRPSFDRAPQAGEILAGLDFDKHKRIIAAVSGGSDSLALLDLAAAATSGTRTELIAVTVDHRLRPESADEARQVGEICSGLGIRHVTVAWDDPDALSGGLIARAREARYRLLAEAAEKLGAGLILLGHTADDQAETVAMRAARRQYPSHAWDRGGAGMARATLLDGRIWLIRPLLGHGRQALRKHLSARGLSWIEDPTNCDTSYERPRIRARLTDAAPLLRAATEAAILRQALGGQAAHLIDRHVAMPAPGLFRLDPALPRQGASKAALYAFRCLLALAGGREHLPDHERSAVLFSRLAEPGLCATLSRTRVEVHREGIFLSREHRNLPGIEARPGVVWDSRHRLQATRLAPGTCIAPLGETRASEAAEKYPAMPERLVRIALSAEPELVYEEGMDISPDAVFERRVAPFARFLGEYDLELAAALAEVVGASPPPISPFARHIAG
ncbi:MAG: tRNA lysidine(34) synthetase TilS [Rhizobiaceae bacterium]